MKSILAMKRGASTSSKKWRNNLPSSYFFYVIFTLTAVIPAFLFIYLVDPSWIAPDQAMELIIEWILSLAQSIYHTLQALFAEMRETWSRRERYAPLGGTEQLANKSPEEETSKAGVLVSFMNRNDFDLNELPPVAQQPNFAKALEEAVTRRDEQNERKAKSEALNEIMDKYKDDMTKAPKEVIKKIIHQNDWLYRELLGNLDVTDTPLRGIPEEYESKFLNCLEKILACQINNIKDLVGLENDLRNDRIKKSIIEPFFFRYGKKK